MYFVTSFSASFTRPSSRPLGLHGKLPSLLLSLLILILFADGSLMTSSDASEFADDASCTASFLSDEGDSAVFVLVACSGVAGGGRWVALEGRNGGARGPTRACSRGSGACKAPARGQGAAGNDLVRHRGAEILSWPGPRGTHTVSVTRWLRQETNKVIYL